MNKKNSIFFQINIFFICVFIIINILVLIQFILDNHTYRLLQNKRLITAAKLVIHARQNKIIEEVINEQLKTFNFTNTDMDLRFLRENASKSILNENEPVDIYYYEGKKYIHMRPPKPLVPIFNLIKDKNSKQQSFLPPPPPPPEGFENIFKPIILIDESDERLFKSFWLFVLAGTDVLLVWFFLFLRKKLMPLLILKNEINKFSKGDLKVNTQRKGKDEISQVANEFHNAIRQVRELNESRNLFLRNIMHELKTPITKGKLVSDTLGESNKKHILIRVFQRLEYLLSEFSKIEELTSGKIKLIKHQFRVIDLIQHALDILLIKESKVDIYINNVLLDVDFDLFTIALKNLIDNSIKYNTNGKPEIFINFKSIKIRNRGKRLKKDINEYFKPFNHEHESADEGLGLGLYITNNIIKIHGYELSYLYDNQGFHNFIIKFN